MFGRFSTFEEADAVARQKTKELGKNCAAIPDPDGGYTIGVELTALSGADFKKRLLEQQDQHYNKRR